MVERLAPVVMEAAEAFKLGADRQELAILNHPRLTNPQRAFASWTVRRGLWIGGNSIGKSWGHAWDHIHFTRGTHPLRKVPTGPRFTMLLGYSYAQMDPLMSKLWAMLPKGEIHPKLYYSPGQGIRGFKEPVIPFVAGPGKGSAIYLATYEQGASRVMGAQVHRVGLDEPPPSHVYAEILPRLNFYRGELRISCTPTPESPPLEYLREAVERGDVGELRTSYCEESVTVRGGLVDWPWKRQAEIDEDIMSYLPDERGMRRDGDWTPLVAGRWFDRVTETCYTNDGIGVGRWTLAVGIDHGTRPGRQIAVLVARNITTGQCIVLDEARHEGVSTSREDARAILSMLARRGVRWSDVDMWVGDRATAESFWGVAKSNRDLQAELARELGMSATEAAAKGLRIETMKKERGSVRRGVALMNSLAATGLLRFNRACARVIQGVREWKGDPGSELKDGIDAARYAFVTLYDRPGQDTATSIPTLRIH